MSNNSYSEDFYEDDDLYYDELEYDDDFDYENYSTDDDDDQDSRIETTNYDEYEYDREDYGDYDNDTYVYEDEYEKTSNKKYYLKDSIKKVLFIIFIIILIFILLLFFKSIKRNKVSKNTNDAIKVIKKIETNYNDIFDKMKNASLEYFTKERINGENTLTLLKMQELNLIDNVDSKYDSVKSVATLTKNILKIEAVADNKSKTKTYVVGNYIYCKDTYYCEKSSTMENKSYEYSKDGDKHFSDWSNWTEYEETSCDTKEISCNEDDYSCLTEVKTDYKTTINEKNMVYQTSRNAFSTKDKEISKVCSNYDYIKINGIYYRTDKDSNFKVLGLINKNTVSNYYNWRYNGREKYHNPPSDTINTRYVFVSEDYSNCDDTCSDHPDYYYDSYTFTKQLVKVINTTNDCNTFINKVIPNYIIENQKITVSREENISDKICYKSTRTREVSQDEKEIEWSNYNDKKLLENGYNYTGSFK